MSITVEEQVTLTRERRELLTEASTAFPCIAYDARYGQDCGRSVPWHWHEELELAYVTEGSARFLLPDQTLDLHACEGIFINSNVLHAASGTPRCRIQTIVFHPSLVAGPATSVFASKYLKPLLAASHLAGYRLTHTEQPSALAAFQAAFKALEEEPYGFEFAAREGLSQVCLAMAKLAAAFASASAHPNESHRSRDSARMHAMLDYIRNHLGEHLSVADIAGSAAIGERECLRCFKRTIGMSPMQYVMQSRIEEGARQLIEYPADSVSSVAKRCGFSSPAYFSNMFKRLFGCTPRTFRQQALKKKPAPAPSLERTPVENVASRYRGSAQTDC